MDNLVAKARLTEDECYLESHAAVADAQLAKALWAVVDWMETDDYNRDGWPPLVYMVRHHLMYDLISAGLERPPRPSPGSSRRGSDVPTLQPSDR